MVSSGCWLAIAASSASLVLADPTGRTYGDSSAQCISCVYKTKTFANCQKQGGTSYWWCCTKASSKPGYESGTWEKCTDAKTKTGPAPAPAPAYNNGGQTGPPMEWLGDTPTKALKICQGDCDIDSHCPEDGVCIERTNKAPVVPGCSTGDSGGTGRDDTDYCSNPGYVSYSGGLSCMDWRGKCSVIASGAATSAAGTFHPKPTMIPALANTKAGVTAHYYRGCTLQAKGTKAAQYGTSWESTLQALPTERAQGSAAASAGFFCPGKTRCEHRPIGGRIKQSGWWIVQRKATSNVASGKTPGEGVFCGGTCRKSSGEVAADAGMAWQNILGPAKAYAKGATIPANYMWCPNTRTAPAPTPPRRRATPPRRRATPPRRRATPPRRRATPPRRRATPPRRRATPPRRRATPVVCDGDCACPCIKTAKTQTVTAGNANTWVTGTTYGYGLKAHNAGKGKECTGTNQPDWCAQRWCIVDRQNCKFKVREVSYSADRSDMFSYETAGVTNYKGNSWIGTLTCLDKTNSFCTKATNDAMKGSASCPCVLPAQTQTRGGSSGAWKPEFVDKTVYGYGCGNHDENPDDGSSCHTSAFTADGLKDDWCRHKWCIVDYKNCDKKTRYVSYTGSKTDIFSYETCNTNFKGNGWTGKLACLDRPNSFCTAAVNTAMAGQATCPCILPAKTQTQATGKPAFVDKTPYGYGCGQHDLYRVGSDCLTANNTADGLAKDWCMDNWCIVDAKNCDLRTRQVGYTANVSDVFSYGTCDTNFKGNSWTGTVKCNSNSKSWCTAKENSADSSDSRQTLVFGVAMVLALAATV